VGVEVHRRAGLNHPVVAVVAGVALAGGASVALTATADATTKKFTCPSAASVNSALGTTIGSPKSHVNGTVTVCYYPQGSNAQQVIVRVQTKMTPTLRAASKSGFEQNGEPTVPITGLGDSAFSSTIGTGSYVTNTVVVEKGSNELLVTAPAPLGAVQSFASQLLPKI
jgi:hypothetical protein